MLVDDSKIFLCGLPLDCQENTLKDFLEGACDNPGAVTKVSIPDKKTFAFVTLSCTEVAKRLLGITLWYCDGVGQLYPVKACPYVKRPFRKKMMQDYKPKTKPHATSMEITEPKAVKYKPPDHVHQFTPDYSMLSHSNPKRRKRKRDDLAVWLGDAGSTSFRKRPRQKKKKKKSPKLELSKTESFQFGNLCPESKAITTNIEAPSDTTRAVEPMVHESSQRFSKATTTNIEATSDTTGVVEPMVYENSQRSSKAISTDIEETTNTTGAVEPVVHENCQRLSKANIVTTNIEDTFDTRGVVEPIEGKIPAVEVVCADGQTTSSTISSHTQVIIDHDYLGPLCLQFTRPPSVTDVKNELMERTGLPVKDQLLYYNGKKLSDSLALRPMIDDHPENLTLVLSMGTLKGGVPPKKAPDEGATGNEDPSRSQKQGESTNPPGNDKNGKAPDTDVNEETSEKVASASVNKDMALPSVKGSAAKTHEFFEGIKRNFTDHCGEWGESDCNGTFMFPSNYERDFTGPIDDVSGAAPCTASRQDFLRGLVKGNNAEEKIFNVLKFFGKKTNQPMFVLSNLKFPNLKFIECCYQQEPDKKLQRLEKEIDFVIVHLNIGVILFEVKAVGEWPKNDQKIRKQLMQGEMIIKALLKRESGIPVYKVCALPFAEVTEECKVDILVLTKSDLGSFDKWMKNHFAADKCGSQEKQELLTLLHKLVGQKTHVSFSIAEDPLTVKYEDPVSEAESQIKLFEFVQKQHCLETSYNDQQKIYKNAKKEEKKNRKKEKRKKQADGSESGIEPHHKVLKTSDGSDPAKSAECQMPKDNGKKRETGNNSSPDLKQTVVKTEGVLKEQILFLNSEQMEVWEGACHQLIFGVPGSGKTILLQCRALECAISGETVIICVPTPLRNLYDDFFNRNEKVMSIKVQIYTFVELCEQSEFLAVNKERFHLFVDELQVLAFIYREHYLKKLIRKQKGLKTFETCYCWLAINDSQFVTRKNRHDVSNTPLLLYSYHAQKDFYIKEFELSQSISFFHLKTAMRCTKPNFEFVDNYAKKKELYLVSETDENDSEDVAKSIKLFAHQIGHNIGGDPVYEYCGILGDVVENIKIAIETWKKKHVAVLFTDSNVKNCLSYMCDALNITVCGVGEKKDAVVLATSDQIRSYEWPVVIAVTTSEPGYRSSRAHYRSSMAHYCMYSRAVLQLIVVKPFSYIQRLQKKLDRMLKELQSGRRQKLLNLKQLDSNQSDELLSLDMHVSLLESLILLTFSKRLQSDECQSLKEQLYHMRQQCKKRHSLLKKLDRMQQNSSGESEPDEENPSGESEPDEENSSAESEPDEENSSGESESDEEQSEERQSLLEQLDRMRQQSDERQSLQEQSDLMQEQSDDLQSLQEQLHRLLQQQCYELQLFQEYMARCVLQQQSDERQSLQELFHRMRQQPDDPQLLQEGLDIFRELSRGAFATPMELILAHC